MVQETGKQSPTSNVIAAQAAKVANLLTTQYTPKKHGGYNIYQDEKISIALDTYAPNVHIQIADGDGGRVTVFSAAHHSLSSPSIHRPGRWTQHLEGLHRNALEVEQEKKARRNREKAADLTQRYGPVDDAAIFTDDPEAGSTGSN